MKKITTLLLAAFLIMHASAQQAQPVFTINPFPKTITVSGSAEMELIPDEIFVNVELREYQKKGEAKKDIESIKNHFLESCVAVGIPDSDISIASYSGFNNNFYLRRKKRNPDLLASITYQVKFKNSKLMDNLVEKLDDDATQNFLIVSVSHSRAAEFRKQLKIKAIQAAKDKAIYLTESIGEKPGEAITISEPVEWQPQAYNNNFQSNSALQGFKRDQASIDDFANQLQGIDFRKIKLRYEVTVVFALK